VSLARSRKQRIGTEYLAEYVFRPLAHVLVVPMAALRVPPPIVVIAGAATGIVAAVAIADGAFLLAAILLQLKTILDNADGQLARLTDQVTLLGRYLDSESDLLVNFVLCAALGAATGAWFVCAVTFVLMTAVLGANFNIEHAYRRVRVLVPASPPPVTRTERVLARVYDVVYGPQDRFAESFFSW
jgi:hypothetical protein